MPGLDSIEGEIRRIFGTEKKVLKMDNHEEEAATVTPLRTAMQEVDKRPVAPATDQPPQVKLTDWMNQMADQLIQLSGSVADHRSHIEQRVDHHQSGMDDHLRHIAQHQIRLDQTLTEILHRIEKLNRFLGLE